MMQKNAPDFSLEGKVTLVTGASRGIGRACALACARAGSDIVLGVRDVAASAGLVAELEGAGRKVLPVELDIPNKAHIAQAVDAALTKFGRIDVRSPGDLRTPMRDLHSLNENLRIRQRLSAEFASSGAAKAR